jgi:hypothetical protein
MLLVLQSLGWDGRYEPCDVYVAVPYISWDWDRQEFLGYTEYCLDSSNPVSEVPSQSNNTSIALLRLAKAL